MAKVMGVSPQFISQILKGERSVPAKHCIAIETATAGKVTRYELCEEVFGPAPRKAAAA